MAQAACGRAEASGDGRADGGGQADNRAPGGEALVTGVAVGGGSQQVAARAAVVHARAVGGAEALRVPRRLKPAHPPRVLAGGLVRMLGAIIAPLVLPVLDTGQPLPPGSTVAGERVRADDAGHRMPALAPPTEELLRCGGIPARSPQDSEHGAVPIDSAPPLMGRAIAAHEDRIAGPLVTRARAPSAEGIRVGLAAA